MNPNPLRRLLIAVPTLIGITLLVFALRSLSAGDSGAGDPSGGGPSALERARLADRFGLEEPWWVQHAQWLARASPVKLGRQPLRGPGGVRVRSPQALPRTSSGEVPNLPASSTATGDAGPALEHYERAAEAHAADRVTFLRARIAVATARDESSLRAERKAWIRAESSRLELRRAWLRDPYPSAGITLIPGVLGLDAPDLGVSISTGRPVWSMIAGALPTTVVLNGAAVVLIFAVGIATGVAQAAREGSLTDRATKLGTLALWSAPTVIIAVSLQGLFGPGGLDVLPAAGLNSPGAEDAPMLPWVDEQGAWRTGRSLDAGLHAILPVLCLAAGGLAIVAAQTRAAMLEQLSSDHVRTALAKGLGTRDVLLRHGLRGALPPVLVLLTASLPTIVSGSVIVEHVFNLPGMGRLLLQAVGQRDHEVIAGVVLVIGTVTLLSMALGDALCAAADPRWRTAQEQRP